jgi:hypothetical protein
MKTEYISVVECKTSQKRSKFSISSVLTAISVFLPHSNLLLVFMLLGCHLPEVPLLAFDTHAVIQEVFFEISPIFPNMQLICNFSLCFFNLDIASHSLLLLPFVLFYFYKKGFLITSKMNHFTFVLIFKIC